MAMDDEFDAKIEITTIQVKAQENNGGRQEIKKQRVMRQRRIEVR